MMTDFTIHIDAPELAQAIQALAGALGRGAPEHLAATATKPDRAPAAPAAGQAPVQTPRYGYVPAPTQSPTVQVAPMTAPVAVPVAAPVRDAAPAPVAPAPQYTPEMIQLATAPLIDAGKGEQLKGLLSKYGVMRVSDIPRDALGAFATDLRALGARI